MFMEETVKAVEGMRVPIVDFSGVPAPLVRSGPDRFDFGAGYEKPLVC